MDIWDEHGLLGMHLNLAAQFRLLGLTPQQPAELWSGRHPEKSISQVISWTPRRSRESRHLCLVASAPRMPVWVLSHLIPGMTFALGNARVERIPRFIAKSGGRAQRKTGCYEGQAASRHCASVILPASRAL